MFPTLVGRTFMIFNCRAVGSGTWLHVDLEESCQSDRYRFMVILLGVSQLILYVCGLPLILLYFLVRNRDRLRTHAVQSRYGVYFSGYKDNRFYWEIILSVRKISIVGLGIFGPEMGAVRQSQVALLILGIFIGIEVLGSPFREPTERHKILAKLELSSLIVLSLTMWSGLMIFSSSEVDDTTTVQTMTVFVVLLTTAMMVWLVAQLARECMHENNVSPAKVRKNVVALRKRLGSLIRGETKDVDGDVEMKDWEKNPAFISTPRQTRV